MADTDAYIIAMCTQDKVPQSLTLQFVLNGFVSGVGHGYGSGLKSGNPDPYPGNPYPMQVYNPYGFIHGIPRSINLKNQGPGRNRFKIFPTRDPDPPNPTRKPAGFTSHPIRQNWTAEEQQEAKKIIMVGPITFDLRTLFNSSSKLKSYEEGNINTLESRASSPGATGSGFESRSRSQSQSRSAALAFTGIAQAAKRYRDVSQSLDFTATPGSTTGDQSLGDEVNHYMTSPLPSRKSTDIVGYWTFYFKKARLNFMADWQSAAVPDEEEDWLRILASTADGPRQARTSSIATINTWGQIRTKSSNTADNRRIDLSEAGLSPALSTAQQLQQTSIDFIDLSRLEQLRVI
ncbi:hypothetical protein FB451DRAFT_1172232 [Mycena latifolia]|nr:hypothetical protein FB451DRAFT_1172232 [Mycena latifolia]